VTVWDRRQRLLRVLPSAACGFGYRTSRFKAEDAGRFIVLDVTLRLEKRRPVLRYAELERMLPAVSEDPDAAVRQVRDAVLAIRRKKSMVLDDPQDPNRKSAGSFFTNPVVSPELAAALEARLPKGAGLLPRFPQSDGRVKISAAFLI